MSIPAETAVVFATSFPISVMNTVLLGHWRRIGWAGAATEKMRESARKALAAVGLEGFARRPIETLSVGQLQRVLFARLIVQDAELILLDEPFASVDWRTSEDLLLLVESWHRERRTVAAVLHDLDQFRAHFPDTLLIARECVAWGATREVVIRLFATHRIEVYLRSQIAGDSGRVSGSGWRQRGTVPSHLVEISLC